jgi:hypothetical protein
MAHANQDPFAELDFVGMFINDPQTPEAAQEALRQPPLAPRRPPHAVHVHAPVAAPPAVFDDMPVPVLHRRQLIFEASENDDQDDMDVDL